MQTLPVLSACNDLRALTELGPGNITLFQTMGGVQKMVDNLCPHGPNAPYATHIARTLPIIMDKEGRSLFHDYAIGTDAHGSMLKAPALERHSSPINAALSPRLSWLSVAPRTPEEPRSRLGSGGP